MWPYGGWVQAEISRTADIAGRHKCRPYRPSARIGVEEGANGMDFVSGAASMGAGVVRGRVGAARGSVLGWAMGGQRLSWRKAGVRDAALRRVGPGGTFEDRRHRRAS